MDNYNIHFIQACDELLEEKDEDAIHQWKKAGRMVVLWLKQIFPESKRDA